MVEPKSGVIPGRYKERVQHFKEIFPGWEYAGEIKTEGYPDEAVVLERYHSGRVDENVKRYVSDDLSFGRRLDSLIRIACQLWERGDPALEELLGEKPEMSEEQYIQDFRERYEITLYPGDRNPDRKLDGPEGIRYHVLVKKK